LARCLRTWTNYDGLIPVPPHLWHLTILSPFFRVPFPSQFLHGLFFSPVLFFMVSSHPIGHFLFWSDTSKPINSQAMSAFGGKADMVI
jgi:hypothetical protein